MKICDNCGLETKDLLQLREEFESLEVCKPCGDALEEKLTAAWRAYQALLKEARAREFQKWRLNPRPSRSPWYVRLFDAAITQMARESKEPTP